ncbi:MAG: hypothetical protein WC762_03675 [Methylobacter sp.]|jgi:hypothetical protein
MNFLVRRLVILVAILLSTPADAFYTITDLGVLACSPSCGTAINNKEQLIYGFSPVVIASFIAFIGLALSNIFVHWSSMRREEKSHHNAMLKEEESHRNAVLREKDSLLREKAEALGEILLESQRWLISSMRSLCPHNKTFVDPISPVIKAVVIFHLYFPELENELSDIMNKHTIIDKFIYDQSMILSNETDKDIWFANYENSQQFIECGELIANYGDTIEEFLPKVTELINKQFKGNKANAVA